MASLQSRWREVYAADRGCLVSVSLGVKSSNIKASLEQYIPLNEAGRQTFRNYDAMPCLSKFYVATPPLRGSDQGQQFIVHCKNLNHSKLHGLGARVFIDQGEEPDPESYDHFFWFGENNSEYTIDGFYDGADHSRAFEFALGSTLVRPEAAPRAQHPPESKVGWLVVRFFAVTGFEDRLEDAHDRPTMEKETTGKADLKTAARPGGIRKRKMEFEKQAQLASEPCFEARLRYVTFQNMQRLIFCLDKSGFQDTYQLKMYRSLPLYSLLDEVGAKRDVVDLLYRKTREMYKNDPTRTNKYDVEAPFVSLVDLVKMINAHMCPLGSLIVCRLEDKNLRTLAGTSDGAADHDVVALRKQCREQMAQGPVCVPMPKEVMTSGGQKYNAHDEGPKFTEKLDGLHTYYIKSRQFYEFEGGYYHSPSLYTAKVRPVAIHLENSDDDP